VLVRRTPLVLLALPATLHAGTALVLLAATACTATVIILRRCLNTTSTRLSEIAAALWALTLILLRANVSIAVPSATSALDQLKKSALLASLGQLFIPTPLAFLTAQTLT
jgi:hypothetical protein